MQTITKYKCSVCRHSKVSGAFKIIHGRQSKGCADCLSKKATYNKPASSFSSPKKVKYVDGWEDVQPTLADNPEYVAYKDLLASVFTEDTQFTIGTICRLIGRENVRYEWTYDALRELEGDKVIEQIQGTWRDTFQLRSAVVRVAEPVVQDKNDVMDALSIQFFGKDAQERRAGWKKQRNTHLFENNKFVPQPLFEAAGV